MNAVVTGETRKSVVSWTFHTNTLVLKTLLTRHILLEMFGKCLNELLKKTVNIFSQQCFILIMFIVVVEVMFNNIKHG